MEKLLKLKETNKILYYLILLALALPIVGVAVASIVSPSIRSWLIKSGQQLLDNSVKKDEKLKEEIDNIQKQVLESENKDQKLKEEIEKIESEDDANWHKKV